MRNAKRIILRKSPDLAEPSKSEELDVEVWAQVWRKRTSLSPLTRFILISAMTAMVQTASVERYFAHRATLPTITGEAAAPALN